MRHPLSSRSTGRSSGSRHTRSRDLRGASLWPESTLEKYVPQLQAAGLTVTHTQEWSGSLSFTDVGAIVYYLKAVPWLVPGFSVDTHLEHLLALQRRLEGGDGLTFAAWKYLIEARKGLQR